MGRVGGGEWEFSWRINGDCGLVEFPIYSRMMLGKPGRGMALI